jgi:hypothetical protein
MWCYSVTPLQSPISNTVSSVGLKHHMRDSLHTLYKQIGRNRSVTKGTLLFRLKQFFFAISTTFAYEKLKRYMWHCLRTLYKEHKFVRNRLVKRVLYSCCRISFSPLSRVRLHQGDSNVTWDNRHTHTHTHTHTTSRATLVEIGQ